MSLITYAAFRDKMRSEIWPAIPGEARNLREAHNAAFQEAMAEASYWVKCLQVNHCTVHRFCSTYVECAKTVVPAPVGFVRRVYTVVNDQHCDKVHYNSWSWKEIECWANSLRHNYTTPTNEDLPALKGGYRVAESTTDVTGGRARIGAWAIHNHRLYVAPWIQSNESLVIEWDGAKKVWLDDDVIDDEQWDSHVREFIKDFVRWKHERDFGCDKARARELKESKDDGLASIIYQCDARTRAINEEECTTPQYGATRGEYEDDDDAAEADVLTIANIGAFGDPSNDPRPSEVKDLVESWDPDFIVTNGDNQFGDPADYDARVGEYYSDFITDDLLTNKFWPAAGVEDWASDDLAAFKDYFTLPNNERYYELVRGPIQFFFVSADSQEPDGIASDSMQAEWLQIRLALSTAKWKVVVLSDAPYTSATGKGGGNTTLRWPFAAWGADMVISAGAHLYERLEVDAIPYIVNGAGGTTLDTFDSALPETQLQYADDNGALKIEVNCDELTIEFWSAPTGDVLDSTKEDELTLTQ